VDTLQNQYSSTDKKLQQREKEIQDLKGKIEEYVEKLKVSKEEIQYLKRNIKVEVDKAMVAERNQSAKVQEKLA
jgi:peptidoglycan hydrolase CwlO-like protein